MLGCTRLRWSTRVRLVADVGLQRLLRVQTRRLMQHLHVVVVLSAVVLGPRRLVSSRTSLLVLPLRSILQSFFIILRWCSRCVGTRALPAYPAAPAAAVVFDLELVLLVLLVRVHGLQAHASLIQTACVGLVHAHVVLASVAGLGWSSGTCSLLHFSHFGVSPSSFS